MDSRSPSVAVGAIAVLGVAIAVAHVLRREKNRRRTHTCDEHGTHRLPPYAPAGMLETIASLTGGNLPWFFLRMTREAGVKIFRLRIPMVPGPCWVVVGDVGAATEICNDPLTTRPSVGYEDIDRCIGSGPSIVSMEGLGWKHRRKATAPAFSPNHIKRMNEVALRHTDRWIRKKLDPLVQKGLSFDVGKEMVRLTISIIIEAAFEFVASEQQVDFLAHEFYLASQEFGKSSGGVNPIRTICGRLIPEVRRAQLAKQNLFDFAKKLICDYRERQSVSDSSSSGTVISCIMHNEEYQHDDERASDVVMWMYAGFDNTGYSTAWSLLELARHPSEVSKLRNELANVDDWAKTDAVRNIVKESMRLHPVTPGGPLRVPGRDFCINNICIPAGSVVQLPSMLYTRDGDVFEDPEMFLPSRWQTRNKRQSMTETFLPYVAGRHNCAGQALANAELHSVLSCLIRHYDFRVHAEGEEQYFITLKPVGARLIASKASPPALNTN